MKLLIVGEDIEETKALEACLRRDGFETDCVNSGEDAIAFAGTGIYDLLILASLYSASDGCEVVCRIRENRSGVPILILSSEADPEAEIKGLNAGADYYLTRPLEERKLLACIQALLRRQGSQVNEMAVGNTALNLSNSMLQCGEKQERLSAREFELLRFLMSSEGKIVSKELILCRIWGFDSNAVENHVEVYVGHLRKKLGRIGSNVTITAIRRMGYILEADEE